jgi:hypothetical protein
MDLAKIRFIWKAFIKERGAEVLEKSTCPPSCESPFKDTAPRRTAVGNSETNCQCGSENNHTVGIGGLKIMARNLNEIVRSWIRLLQTWMYS